MNYFAIPGYRYFIPKDSPLNSIADHFCTLAGVKLSFVRKHTRQREVVRHRQALAYFMRLLTREPLHAIAKALGGYDHSTVIHSIQTVKALIATDPEYRKWLQALHPTGAKLEWGQIIVK